MKKGILLVVLLALFAIPMAVSAIESNASMVIDAGIGSNISVSLSNTSRAWTLEVGDNVFPGETLVTVASTSPYYAGVYGDSYCPGDGCRLTAWNATSESYKMSIYLSDPLYITVDERPHETFSGDMTLESAGSPTSGREYSISFDQYVTYLDPVNETYRMVIRFSATTTA